MSCTADQVKLHESCWLTAVGSIGEGSKSKVPVLKMAAMPAEPVLLDSASIRAHAHSQMLLLDARLGELQQSQRGP